MHVNRGPSCPVRLSCVKYGTPLWCPHAQLSRRTSPRASEETVHALDSLAAVVQALGPNALAAGVVKPAVLGATHGLAVQLALAD
uniref:Uncharacterized protein n=1 Tax=Anguilla anguilla TaxID=7936 RepID=A0A0E9QQI0_ANGAN